MNQPPVWNLWSRFRVWERENRIKAQIMAIAAVAIGLIIVMFLVTAVIVLRTLR
jgi:hypothetical protein